MPTRRTRRRGNAAAQASELALAAPVVVAHRLARMAGARHPLSARDRREFTGMVIEKQLAFSRSWLAAWQGALAAQAELAAWAWRNAGAIASASLRPVHAKATSNARRLTRSAERRRRR